MHAREVHAHEMHACEIHAYEVHAYEVYACEIYAHEVHAHEMHACEMHAYELHAYEVHASGCALQLGSLQYRWDCALGVSLVRWLRDNLKNVSDLNTQWFQRLIDVTYMKIGWFLMELLMFSV